MEEELSSTNSVNERKIEDDLLPSSDKVQLHLSRIDSDERVERTKREEISTDGMWQMHANKEDHQPSQEAVVTKSIKHTLDAPVNNFYGIDDVPPIHVGVALGLQHYLTMFGGTVSIPFLICPALCMERDDPAQSYIISTIFFVSGIVTLLQTIFGVRLPIVQGGTFTFIIPTFAILSLPENQCPPDFPVHGWGRNMSYAEKTEEWQMRIRIVQGAICAASISQLLLGYCGIIGFLLNYITPLTIAPSTAMIGLSLFDNASYLASKNWGVAGGTILLLIVMSQYMKEYTLPCIIRKAWLPKWKNELTFRESETSRHSCFMLKCHHLVRFFQLFPVLLTILIMWGLCGLLTYFEIFEPGNASRTDLKLDIIKESEWIRIPYPFQWGWPTVTVAGVLGMMAGVFASAVESIGDYYACARISGAPKPPVHAINRGIGTEGLGCIIAGMYGSGSGTTSYSENVGAIGITKVGSRRVVQIAACLMIFFGSVCKLGAAFLTIPEPIIGGVFCVMFGIITAVGLSNLQFIDLNSSRNIFILGFSLFFGLVLPKWMASHSESIKTSSEVFNQIVTILLSTSMFVSGMLGFVLDNTVPGTPEERGMIAWNAQSSCDVSDENFNENLKQSTYDFPFGMKWIRSMKWTRYIPCSPTYQAKE